MDDINTGEITFSELYLKYDEELERFWVRLLQNIMINIESAHEEKTLSQGKDSAISTNSDVMQEILLQGVMELEDKEQTMIYLRYGLNIEVTEISRIMGIASAEVEKKSLVSKQKFENIIKGDVR